MIFSFVGHNGAVLVRDTAVVVIDRAPGCCPSVFMRAGYVTAVFLSGAGPAQRAVWSLYPRCCQRGTDPWAPPPPPRPRCAPGASQPARVGGGTACRTRPRRTRPRTGHRALPQPSFSHRDRQALASFPLPRTP